jgi:response regulator of citrate/malate metabolism
MTQKEFKQFINKASEKLTIEEISNAFNISHPSVQRWIDGVSMPHKAMHPVVVKTIENLLGTK